MQFFFLLLFNVFLGAVLYLVISLKLERSASEFRERRLRKEMDEIIKEFNITAERNITLLENKIRVLRTLLEKSGDCKSLDITLEQEERKAEPETGVAAAEKRAEPPFIPRPAYRAGDESANNAGDLIKKGLILLFNRIIPTSLRRDGGTAAVPGHRPVGEYDGGTDGMPAPDAAAVPPRGANALIEKDLGNALTAGGTGPEIKKLVTEKEILEIVARAEDRYQLISLLSENGCDIEDISRYSGMPAGEVRLVLNLNRHAPGTTL